MVDNSEVFGHATINGRLDATAEESRHRFSVSKGVRDVIKVQKSRIYGSAAIGGFGSTSAAIHVVNSEIFGTAQLRGGRVDCEDSKVDTGTYGNPDSNSQVTISNKKLAQASSIPDAVALLPKGVYSHFPDDFRGEPEPTEGAKVNDLRRLYEHDYEKGIEASEKKVVRAVADEELHDDASKVYEES